MRVQVDELRDIARQAILHYGYDEEQASLILEVLMYAQLRGNNQGVVKLIGAGMPRDAGAKPIEVAKETPLSVLINGNGNHGMVVLTFATDRVIEKARQNGFGIAGTHNTATSTGALGYYANRIAGEGLVGFVFAGSPERVCMHGSYEPIFGTNPIAIGIPTENEPLVLDMATSAMAFYGLIEAKTAGQSIPDDVAYDAEGRPTTDPDEALKGAVRPFDRGYKGAGLAMMIEILTGPLVGASFVGIGDTTGNWGNLVFAIDPQLLVDGSLFKQQTAQLVERVKNTKRLPGTPEILVPGERGNRLTRRILASGEIEIEDNLWQALKEVASADSSA